MPRPVRKCGFFSIANRRFGAPSILKSRGRPRPLLPPTVFAALSSPKMWVFGIAIDGFGHLPFYSVKAPRSLRATDRLHEARETPPCFFSAKSKKAPLEGGLGGEP